MGLQRNDVTEGAGSVWVPLLSEGNVANTGLQPRVTAWRGRRHVRRRIPLRFPRPSARSYVRRQHLRRRQRGGPIVCILRPCACDSRRTRPCEGEGEGGGGRGGMAKGKGGGRMGVGRGRLEGELEGMRKKRREMAGTWEER